MQKIKCIPALLVALSAPAFTASAWATPVNQHSAWDIKQPLSQSYAHTVAIGSVDEEWEKSSFSFAQFHGGELHKLLIDALASAVMRKELRGDMSVDVPASSLTAIAGTSVVTIAASPAATVPEPGSLALLGAGMAGIVMMRRRAKAIPA